MIKTCSNCNKQFKTRDSRQSSCSKACADICRSKNAWRPKLQPEVAKAQNLSLRYLPPPEELPAPYAKRVHDMWEALIGNAPTRIA